MPAQGRKTFKNNVPVRTRSERYHSKGLWAIKAKNGGKFPESKKEQPKKEPRTQAKQTKNGHVAVTRPRIPATYINQPNKYKPRRRVQAPPRIRPSLVPGRVAIILAGKFAGRRVIVLRHLPSGLVVVTGPQSLNNVPMRRVNPAYLIATSVKVTSKAASDILNNSKDLNDSLFAKAKGRLAKSQEKQEKKEEGKEGSKMQTEGEKKEEGKDGKEGKGNEKLKVVIKHPREARILKRTQRRSREKKKDNR